MSTDEIFDGNETPFKSVIRGSFGSVKTNASYELAFVLSSIPMSRINELETASDALDVQLARFSDLLQRDIDYERVETIVNGYLERGANRVVFFPPLLVSLVALEDPGAIGQATQISEKYDLVEDEQDGAWLVRKWDRDRFLLQVHAAGRDSGVLFFHNGAPRAVHPYGCHLKWNPSVVKLVIIDGQHRLCALKTLYNNLERRHVVKDMQIPVCVVFPPNATVGNPRGETIPAVLRDLFVTINQTAKEVSGHFLVLLDDKSLSALAVRDLAESWKAQTLGANLTKLHLLEWNQRLKSRSNQIEKKYSVTTVSIISDVLDKNIFDPKTGGLTNTFLNLSERKIELESDENWTRVDSISNREFHPAQQEILQQQVATYLTPAISVLFSEPGPYKRKRLHLEAAKTWLDQQVVKMARGADVYRDQCLKHFRKWTRLDDISARSIEEDFEERCENEESDVPFFLNVFQQGMLRAWIEITRFTVNHGISPETNAKAFVRGLEKLCFAPAKGYFSSDQVYTRLSIYRDGGAVIVSESSREQWKRLILANFSNRDVWKSFAEVLSFQLDEERMEELERELRKLNEQSLFDFFEDLENAIQRDFEKNWKDREVTAQQQENIRKIIVDHGDTSEEFKEFIASQLTKPRRKKAQDRLTAILELDVGS